MGVAITDLIPSREIGLTELGGKVLAVDASLWLYQFVTTIRQRDGTPLKDSKGNITSHLTGLFSRTINLLQKGVKLIYVFDGKVPDLKKAERARRAKLKEEAEALYKVAMEKQDVESMRKYASRFARLTGAMIEECKELLDALGVPWMVAPSEAEAQASHIVKNGDAWAVATQDADVLMFGAPKVVKNLNILGKRKKINAFSYGTVKPELVESSVVLNELGIDREQLIALCMQVGTDYNIGGIKGIGPKNAHKNVLKFEKDIKGLFETVKWDDFFDYGWEVVFNQIVDIPVTDEYDFNFGHVNESALLDLLVSKHDFSRERIMSGIEKIKKQQDAKAQKSLFDF